MDLSNVELLRQATIDSARIVHLDSQVGTVKVGKLADLILRRRQPGPGYFRHVSAPRLRLEGRKALRVIVPGG